MYLIEIQVCIYNDNVICTENCHSDCVFYPKSTQMDKIEPKQITIEELINEKTEET